MNEILLEKINNLKYNSEISINIFRYIHKNNILYSHNNNNIFFDINQLNDHQLNDLLNYFN